METIPISECVKIGYLQKPHGIQGGMILNFQEKYEDSIAASSVFFIEIDGLLVPFFISEEGVRFRSGNTVFLKFDWVDSGDAAREICGCSVFLKRDEIIQLEEESAKDGLKGFLVFDSAIGEVGQVKEVDDFSGNIVLTIDHKGSELLIPFNEKLIDSIDKKGRNIHLNLPEGLIES